MTPRQLYHLQASNCYLVSAGLFAAPCAYLILTRLSWGLFIPPSYTGYWVLAICQVAIWLLLAIGLGLRAGRRVAIGAFGLYALGLVVLLTKVVLRFPTYSHGPRWWAVVVLWLLLVLFLAAKCTQCLFRAHQRQQRLRQLVGRSRWSGCGRVVPFRPLACFCILSLPHGSTATLAPAEHYPTAHYGLRHARRGPSPTKVWDKTFGGTARDEIVALRAAPGGYILVGNTASGLDGTKTQATRGMQDMWAIKLNADGTQLWDRSIGGTSQDGAAGFALTPDGGILLGGTSHSDISGDKTQARKGLYDFWVVQLDAAGTKLWDKSYGGDLADDLRALLPTADGGYLLGEVLPPICRAIKHKRTKAWMISGSLRLMQRAPNSGTRAMAALPPSI
ncbi:hypothetical protein [Hymenobacter cellulosilyticus]|uniref:Bulb-type lectin domain-containing protein n=1 Tax=Hymenobacter cellulosilyticus TaxID=2932248 RepID=A0A8T9QFD0_9BACT|nr:hypothetical protein [Hymenobacter cellulosilyticus]UOQ75121.1 hypothetical protein MUN79_29035 [Hymenobacter cellulosilyticus]